MPKIATIETIALGWSFPVAHSYGMARGLTHGRQSTIVRVRTDAGVEGLGEAWGPCAMTGAALDLIRGYLVGTDLFAHEHVFWHILAKHYHFGVQNPMVAALSGLDVAVRDAAARTVGLPLASLTGGIARTRLPVYASGGYVTLDPDRDFPAQLDRLTAHAWPAVKIKIGLGPASDERRVAMTRERIGAETQLMVDANGNYTLDLALDSMRRIARYDIAWYEEPLAPQDFDGYHRLGPLAPMPVATGEALYTVFDFQRLIATGGVHVVQPDLSLCGGFWQAKRIADLALVNHVRLSPHVWGGAIGLAAACHFVAALPAYPHGAHVPAPCLVEYDLGENPLRDRLLAEPIRLEDGCLVLPDGPGLGVTLDPAAVDAHRLPA